VYSCSEKKNQGRFRPVGSDHSLVREIGSGSICWINLLQDRNNWGALLNTVMNFRNPQNAEKFLSSCKTGGFSESNKLYGVRLVSQFFYYSEVLVRLYVSLLLFMPNKNSKKIVLFVFPYLQFI
jgi:hypothetical protein